MALPGLGDPLKDAQDGELRVHKVLHTHHHDVTRGGAHRVRLRLEQELSAAGVLDHESNMTQRIGALGRARGAKVARYTEVDKVNAIQRWVFIGERALQTFEERVDEAADEDDDATSRDRSGTQEKTSSRQDEGDKNS